MVRQWKFKCNNLNIKPLENKRRNKMEQGNAFHRIHDNCCIKETIPGTWLVYDHDREPVSGTAVYQYRENGTIVCQDDGIGMNPENPIKKDCIHIHKVRVWLGDQVLEQC
tara:strand:+ start:64 stop:393 length:330 start_codon:yes stop_codon:yes gene_type:complete